jgi:hypothetical protein
MVQESVWWTRIESPEAVERAAKKKRTESAGTDLDAVEFARARLGFQPDELQATVLRSTAARGILNCTRQWGKSTVTAVKAIHQACAKPGSLVLAAAPSRRQSGEFLNKVEKLMRRGGMAVKGDGYNELSVLFANGSRMVGLPGVAGTVRGFSEVSLLLIDEASRVDEAMYQALRPMLAVGDGHLWLMSTPNFKSGFFYDTWEHGGPDWFRVRAPATECRRISERFLAEEMAELGEDIFRREYLCEFLDSGTEVFDRELLAGAVDDEVRQLEI